MAKWMIDDDGFFFPSWTLLHISMLMHKIPLELLTSYTTHKLC